MKQKLLTYFTGVSIALLFVCGLTFAKASTVSIVYRAQIGKTLVLSPGNYRVVVNPQSEMSTAAFYQNGKLMGKASVRVVSEAKKNSQTEVFYGSPHNDVRNVSQIDFNGWRDELLFAGSHSGNTAAE